MKVNKYFDKRLSENRVDIYYQKEDSQLCLLFDYLEEMQTLIGSIDGVKKKLNPQDIYYFEAVDKKCFAYTKSEVYKVEATLSELEDDYSGKGFIRVSKSTVLNIYKVDYIKMEVNMRVNAYLENEECIIINRSYKSSFNEKLLKLHARRLHENNN